MCCVCVRGVLCGVCACVVCARVRVVCACDVRACGVYACVVCVRACVVCVVCACVYVYIYIYILYIYAHICNYNA